MWTEHACNCPSTCKRVLYVWTGHPTDISFSTCERDHSPRQCHKTWNSHEHFHIRCHTSPGLIIYHAMPVRPYNIPFHTSPGHHTLNHAMPAKGYHIPCHISPGHTICHAMPGRPYLILCLTSLGHTIYHAMFTRPYHIHCAIPRQAIRYIMSCPKGHAIYHAIPHQTIKYTMPYLARPIHISCDAHKAITYIMPCPPDHTIYHAMPTRPYHIPCHACQAIPSHQATPYIIPYQARQYHIPCHAAKTYRIQC